MRIVLFEKHNKNLNKKELMFLFEFLTESCDDYKELSSWDNSVHNIYKEYFWLSLNQTFGEGFKLVAHSAKIAMNIASYDLSIEEYLNLKRIYDDKTEKLFHQANIAKYKCIDLMKEIISKSD